jgi:hypothetical protein
MKLKKCYEILNTFKNTIYDYKFKVLSRLNQSHFTRDRKMSFEDIILCMLNLFKKDAQMEVEGFLKNVKETDMTMSEQAFLKARKKISPTAFIMLNDALVKDVYNDEDYIKFQGYRLLAVDGTVVTLNNTKEQREAFGYVENSTSRFAKAQASCVYDVENEVILHSIIDSYRSDERKLAIEHLKKLESLGLRKD